MGKVRDTEIQKVIISPDNIGKYAYFAVDKDGWVCGYCSRPDTDDDARHWYWRLGEVTPLKKVKPFKGEGWRKQLYNAIGERINQDE